MCHTFLSKRSASISLSERSNALVWSTTGRGRGMETRKLKECSTQGIQSKGHRKGCRKGCWKGATHPHHSHSPSRGYATTCLSTHHSALSFHKLAPWADRHLTNPRSSQWSLRGGPSQSHLHPLTELPCSSNECRPRTKITSAERLPGLVHRNVGSSDAGQPPPQPTRGF